MNTQQLNDAVSSLLTANPWIILLLIWSIVWKIIALWKAAKNDHLTIFIVLTVLNTAGIADIAYILYLHFKNKNTK